MRILFAFFTTFFFITPAIANPAGQQSGQEQAAFTADVEKVVEFSCRTPKNFASWGFEVDVNISGTIELAFDGKYLLSHQTAYRIDCEEGASPCWAEDEGAEYLIVNNPAYRPRKYKNHLQFHFHRLLDNHTHRSGAWGEFQFIFPGFETPEDVEKKFNAYFIMTGIDDHFGTTAPLVCYKESVVSDGTEAVLTTEEAIEKAKQMIATGFGLPNLRLEIDENFLGAKLAQCDAKIISDGQSSHCKVTFLSALKASLVSFLSDKSDVASPLEVAVYAYEYETGDSVSWPIPYYQLKRITWNLRNHINDESTTITLDNGHDEDGEENGPEGGESVIENWVFRLWIGSLSDHGYWAVTDETGEKGTYNYGFN